MTLLPLIERELRVQARRRGLYGLRVAAAVAATLLAALLFFFASSLNTALSANARLLFAALVVLGFGICLLSGPLLAADCLAAERRSGTLDLIFLTGIRGYAVIAAKFAAFSLPALHLLLATLPVMALAFFLGGISGTEFVHVAGALLNTLFLSLAVTIGFSAMVRDGSRAYALSLAVLLGWNVALPAAELMWWVHDAPNIVPKLMLPSPAYALLLSDDTWTSANPGGYGRAIMQGQIVGWLALLAASSLLPGLWRRSLGRTQRVFFHRSVRATKWASRPTDHQPLLWLARRQASHAVGPWLAMLIGCPAVLWCARLAGTGRLPEGSDLLALWLVGVLLKLWLAWSASRGFIEDRESGALELLLVTPLDQRDLWRARLAVLKRQFLGPVLTLAATTLALLYVGDDPSRSTEASAGWRVSILSSFVLLLADVYALSWVGLWQSLSARSATQACARAVLRVLVLPGAVVLLLAGLVMMFANDPGDYLLPLLAIEFVVGLLVDVTACALAMIWVSDGFRAAATGATAQYSRRAGSRPGGG